jgi:hypothetical protein
LAQRLLEILKDYYPGYENTGIGDMFMVRRLTVAWILVAVAAFTFHLKTAAQNTSPAKFALDRVDALEIHNVKAEVVTYRDKKAIKIVDGAPASGDDTNSIAIVKGTLLKNGSIEVSLSGDTVPDAPANLRGFVGIAFRVSNDASRYECFYLRPKNGRSEDQLQRNHSAQYISVPGSQWDKLRSEHPGQYETYVDLMPGEWTKLRIEFNGSTAKLYVHDADQPALIVHDLKQPVAAGSVALWVGPGTIAHFSDLTIRQTGD